MKIPFEILLGIGVAIAVIILAIIVFIFVKKRNQEVDDDYEWARKRRESYAVKKRRSTAKVKTEILENNEDSKNNADSIRDESEIYNSASLAKSLPIDINAIKEKQLKEFEEASAIEEAEEIAQLEEEVYTRESFGKGNGSNLVGWIAITTVIVLNLSIWIFVQPIDQTVVAAIDHLFPFNWFGAVVVTIIEILILQIAAIDVYEIFIGFATEEELKKEQTTKAKSLIFALTVFAIGTLLVLMCKFSYDAITEEGYESHPITFANDCFAWEEMSTFSYNQEYFLSSPSTCIYVDNKYIHLDLKLSHFDYLTDAAEEKYGKGNHMTMMDYIFLEKYAYINEQANEE